VPPWRTFLADYWSLLLPVQIDALNVRVRVVKIRTYVAAIVTHQRMAGPSLTVTGSERTTGGQAR